jgi:SAM-dependent methyltransferase
MPFFAPRPVPHGGLHAAATERNRDPILEVLRRVLPPSGLVLEIASGTGQHVTYFARALPALRWQPSDASSAHLESIRAWSVASGTDNIMSPVLLDVEREPWPVAEADAILNINMIHIAPWSATEALFQGAARLLPASGVLYLYGPYKRGGQHTAPSNQTFDDRLRGEDPSWGVRDIDDLEVLATSVGFEPGEIIAMPANNFSLVYRRAAAPLQAARPSSEIKAPEPPISFGRSLCLGRPSRTGSTVSW